MRLSKKLVIVSMLVVIFFAAGLFVWQRRHSSRMVSSERRIQLSAAATSFGMRLYDNSDLHEYIRSQMGICYVNGGVGSCYATVARLLYDQFGAAKVMADFTETETEKEIFSRCHEVTHYLGRFAYTAAGSVLGAYATSSPVCHGGFYHGVLEQYFTDKQMTIGGLDDTTVKREIVLVCGTAEDHATPRIYSECLHGIGHAMMFITDAELPRALSLCDALPDQTKRETCYSGVFMENSSSSTNVDHPSKYLDSTKPLYPCSILQDVYLKTCYEYQSSYFAELAHWDWSKVVSMCNEVPKAYRAGCFRVVGTNQVGFTQDIHIMKEDCDLITTEDLRGACTQGVVSALGGRYVNQPDRLFAFCAIVDGNMRSYCYSHIGQVVSSWAKDDSVRQSVCSSIPELDARNWCLGAI